MVEGLSPTVKPTSVQEMVRVPAAAPVFVICETRISISGDVRAGLV
jgi:hypothetical protein